MASGSAVYRSFLMLLPRVGSSVSSIGAAAVTTMFSLVAPTFREKFAGTIASASTTTWGCVSDSKPGAEMETVYSPAVSAGTE